MKRNDMNIINDGKHGERVRELLREKFGTATGGRATRALEVVQSAIVWWTHKDNFRPYWFFKYQDVFAKHGMNIGYVADPSEPMFLEIPRKPDPELIRQIEYLKDQIANLEQQVQPAQ